MLHSIDEYDLLEIENINSEEKYNDFAKHVSRKIALKFIKNNCQIDYDLQELLIIKLYNRRLELLCDELKVSNHNTYNDFRKVFTDWVFMAIQDLGRPELSKNYNYNPKLSIQIKNK